jgi:hypothetical protein
LHRSQIPVRSSCGQSWAEMRGGARLRFCEACQHDVVNLSALTEREASEVVGRAGAERLCVRYESDHEGRILFRAEPREAAAGLRGRVAAGALVALTRAAAPLIPVSALLPACAATPEPAPELPASPAPPPAPCLLPSVVESSAADPTLGPSGRLVVLALDRQSHAPLADAVVSVVGAGLNGAQVAVTGKDGRAVFDDLPPAGDYSIRVESVAYRAHSHTTKVGAGQIETLHVGLVEDRSTMVTLGEMVVTTTVRSAGGATQGVKLDQSFIRRVPLR